MISGLAQITAVTVGFSYVQVFFPIIKCCRTLMFLLTYPVIRLSVCHSTSVNLYPHSWMLPEQNQWWTSHQTSDPSAPLKGLFSDGDCMLDPFSVMDLLETLQRCIRLLLLCRTLNWRNDHVAVVTAGVMWCCNERLESPGKMEEVIRKRLPAEMTRLKHESWISMLVLTSFIWWTNTARLLPSDTLWSW